MLVKLNSEFSEFDLQELEQRLETDPLTTGGLLDLSASETSVEPYCWVDFCWEDHN
ncbi:hypothetical protein [Phocaeicola coprocola]|uniref:hypothetical protein n=1 Tax=Phocaeicola coprocola TaxID=310298 RepID=UPI001C387CEB|nr:hypothetical protein [Phocaeicola coprocola]